MICGLHLQAESRPCDQSIGDSAECGFCRFIQLIFYIVLSLTIDTVLNQNKGMDRRRSRSAGAELQTIPRLGV